MRKPDVTLPRRAVAQPGPAIVEGGDCGACCIAGALGISVAEAYELQDKDHRPRGKRDQPVAFGWDNMSWTLANAGWGDNDLIDAVISAVPFWPDEFHQSQAQWGFPGWEYSPAWWDYVRMALQAGYYGFCSIAKDGGGPLVEHDHWVLICGAQERSEPVAAVPGASKIIHEILVSCSASCPRGEWADAQAFLRVRGGYNVILAKPKE